MSAEAARPSERRPSAWDRFWYGEASLVRLGVFRIVMMVTALYALLRYEKAVLKHAAQVTASYVHRPWRPIYLFEVLGIQPPGEPLARAVFAVVMVALVCGLVGFCSRLACALVGLGLVYWAGIHYSFGQPHHDLVALAFGLLALPFAPVGGRLSVDSLLARLRRAGRGDLSPPPERAPLAALPLRLTMVTAAVGYFFAGASKIAIGGLEWANGYTLIGIMYEYNAPWVKHLANDVPTVRFMSVGLLAVQTAFPLVFLSVRLRWIFVPMAIVFHLLSWQTMDTGPFITLWFTLAAFVRWERVPGFLRQRLFEGPWLWRPLWFVFPLWSAWLCWRLYFGRQVPPAYAWFLLPLSWTALLALWSGGKATLSYDPARRGQRLLAAWVGAFDWAGRIELRPAASNTWTLASKGAERRGRESYVPLFARLPLGIVVGPLALVAGGRANG